MKKVGRNDPCPCGSGKKYKHCHFNNDEQIISIHKQRKSSKMNFEQLIKQHNSIQVLGLLAGLQLSPENHGRNYRFEQMTRDLLLEMQTYIDKPLALWDTLKECIETYESGMSQEDLLTNAFTEIAIFEEGNYIVYSGIYPGFTEILNQLTECIFLQHNNLNKEFTKKVRDGVGLLLYMSNRIAQNADHTPHMYQRNVSRNIVVPEYEKAIKHINAVYFEKESLKEACAKRGYDYSVINDFILSSNATELENDDPDNNIVNYRPLIELKDEILFYMPTGVVHAVVNYIYDKAKEYKCYDEVIDLLYERQFHLSCVELKKTNWIETNIELPPATTPLHIKEAVFQFDTQKLAYVSYIEAGKRIRHVESNERIVANPFKDRTDQVISFLSTLSPEQPLNVLCLYIIGEIAQDFFFMWSKPEVGNYSLALTYRELWTITHSDNFDGLSFWKFAKCYSRTSELVRIESPEGIMDVYAIYNSNNGSLLHSDAENPKGGSLFFLNGSSGDFRRGIQKKQNQHAVPIFFERQLAYAKVTRFKNYAPIYIEKEISKYLRIVIESYRMPIWIISKQSKADKDNWAANVCEAIAFWLYKMEIELKPYLEPLRLIQFEFEIEIEETLLNGKEYEKKEFNVQALELTIEINAPVIQVKIPFDYLYSVILPTNEADKILMRAILSGLAKYAEEAGYQMDLNKESISKIVDAVLKPSHAKMLLFSDATVNVRRDSRNLPSLKYIKDTDVSYVLDNLVSFLPQDYNIPKKITDNVKKYELCKEIVKGLTTQISNKLTQFDGSVLLKKLIQLNEKCIQVREFKEILIPAKIACFSSIESEIKLLSDNEKDLVATAQATRILIELIAAKLPSGAIWFSRDDIDELLAFTNQMLDWGSLGDAIHLGLDDRGMGLLPSGRIGTDKKIEREAFIPYATAKAESSIFQDTENFEANYISASKEPSEENTVKSAILENAFLAEFGINITNLFKIVDYLINLGFTKGDSCIAIEKNQLIKELLKIDGIGQNEIDTSLDLLTSVEREFISQPPSEQYNYSDILPWRYGRPLSYLSRPLIRVNEKDGAYYYCGYRHLIDYKDNLKFLLYSGKLTRVKSKEMKAWLASVSGGKGNPFRTKVKNWFEKETGFEVIPYEVRMSKNAPKNHIKTDRDYGDIDLLAFDHVNKVVYSIECKNITGGRNIHEMKVEVDEYLGRDGNDEKAKLKKHYNRHKWLNENKSSLSHFTKDADQYTITSIMMTADEIPLAYLKTKVLLLPVKSFTFLRKKGIAYLNER